MACSPAPTPAPVAAEEAHPEVELQTRERHEFAPPPVRDDLLLGAHPADRLDAATLHMGRGFVIRLERTRMDDIQRVIGAGRLRDFSDAEGFRTWLCYSVPGRERIWFSSNARGNNEVVAIVRAVRDTSVQAEPDCPALPANFRPIAFEPDIWLGASAQRLASLYGEAEARDGWIAYAREGVIRSDNLDYSESRLLALRIEDGRVVELEALKATAY